jgi:hypothetical protein
LQIFLEFNDRYEQAQVYGQLGLIALKQNQSEQVLKYLLPALKIFVESEDKDKIGWVLQKLSLLWQSNNDTSILAATAQILGISSEEIKSMFSKT